MNGEYWKDYYADKQVFKPSNFATLIINELTRHAPYEINTVLDLGAGDGRDSEIFATLYEVDAMDKYSNLDGRSFRGLTELDKNKRYDLIYARWFFHAITEEEENRYLDYIEKHCNYYFAAEFRVIGDVCDDTHERRNIEMGEFMHKLLNRGFAIRFIDIDYGFSKKGDDDPYLGRIIAERKDC